MLSSFSEGLSSNLVEHTSLNCDSELIFFLLNSVLIYLLNASATGESHAKGIRMLIFFLKLRFDILGEDYRARMKIMRLPESLEISA